MSERWVSEKLSAATAGADTPMAASANSAGTSRRREGIGKSFFESRLRKTSSRTDDCWSDSWAAMSSSSMSFQLPRPLRRYDVVGLDPSWCADRETGLGAGGELARGLVVPAQVSRLGRGQIGFCIVSLPAISHRELRVAERRLRFPRHCGTENPDGFVRVAFI